MVENSNFTLFFCTASSEVAEFVLNAGADCVFIDLEITGKQDRQTGLGAKHKFHDIKDFEKILRFFSGRYDGRIYARVDGYKERALKQAKQISEYSSALSRKKNGIIIPMFRSASDILLFRGFFDTLNIVALVETVSALENIEEILDTGVVSQVHIGLRDLTIDMRKSLQISQSNCCEIKAFDNIFRVLEHHLVKQAGISCIKRDIPFRIGGIAPLDIGKHFSVKPEELLKNYVNLKASGAFMSSDFGANADSLEALGWLGRDKEMARQIKKIKKMYLEYKNEK